MDEARTKTRFSAMPRPSRRGDFDTVVAELSDELQPQAPQIAQILPQPVNSATVVSVDVGDDEAVARIHYAGDTKEVTIQSHWQDVDDRPRIVHAAHVE